MKRRPRKDDLMPWGQRQLEEAYQTRERPQCGREDFESGYLASLIDNLVYSAFLIDRRADLFERHAP